MGKEPPNGPCFSLVIVVSIQAGQSTCGFDSALWGDKGRAGEGGVVAPMDGGAGR